MLNKFILILFLLLPLPLQAAVTYDNGASVSAFSVTSVSILGLTVTGSNTLALCGVAAYGPDPAGADSMIATAGSMTKDTDFTPYSNTDIALWKLAGVSGTQDFVFNSSTNQVVNLVCATFAGVDQSTPLGTAVTGDPFDGTGVSVTVPTNGLAWDISAASNAHDCSDGETPGSGQTSRLAACSVFSVTDGEIHIYSSTRSTSGAFTWTTPACCPVRGVIAVPINPFVIPLGTAATRRRS